MNVKLLFRLLLDGAMLLLTIALMAYTLAENELHELLGTSLFVLYFLHQALNIKWYRGLLKGKYTLRRSINTALDGVLTVEILALMISGMMISESMMPFWNFGSVSVGRTIHSLVSHWYLLTMAIHVGLHLEMLLAVLYKVLGKRELGGAGRFLVKLFASGFAVWGGISFVRRGVWEKLILYARRPFFNDGDTWLAVFLDFGAVVWLVALVSRFGYVSRIKKQSNSKTAGVKRINRSTPAVFRIQFALLKFSLWEFGFGSDLFAIEGLSAFYPLVWPRRHP